MIYPSILDRKYQAYLPFLEDVARRVRNTLVNFCESRDYAFVSRIKNVESLAEKIETGRFKTWEDLDDLFACTIITPTLSHEKDVLEFCQETFKINKIIKRGQNKKSPEVFKFDSTRIYAKLKRLTEIDNSNALSIYDILFEVQIKSAFEYAWSVTTHDLVYKSPDIDWKRFRLAAQIKATVEQLDTLLLAFEEMSSIIQESNDSAIKIKRQLAQEINQLFKIEKLPDELQPKDMTRFCENLYNLLLTMASEKEMKKIIKRVTQKIQSTPNRKIPRSISLFQYFCAILICENLIQTPIKKYYFHITDELITLYPSVQEKIDADSMFTYM